MKTIIKYEEIWAQIIPIRKRFKWAGQSEI